MNILFISPSNNIGGAEISLIETIKFLEKSKVKCYVLMPKSKENLCGEVLEKIATKVFYHKIPVFSTSNIKSLSIRSIITRLYSYYKNGFHYSTVKYIQSIIKSHKIDLVHTNTVHSIVGKIAANKVKIPHILHIREITGYSKYSHVFLPNQDKPNFKERFGNHDGLISNSNFCLTENREYFKGKVEKVFYNPISSEFEPSINNNNYFTIGMVANLTSQLKNHSEFINICKTLHSINPNTQFMIFGKLPPAENSYLMQLQKQIEELELGNSFELIGLCDKKDIYSKIDIMIHPYPNESFGRIFIEAMTAGVPIVATASGGALELINDNETGLLYEVGKTEVAAQKVMRIITDENLREKLIENGKQKAKEFLPDVVLSELLEFYYAVLEDYQINNLSKLRN